MYTTKKSALAKLDAYERELTSLYEDARRRHDRSEARRVYDLRRRVRRARLIREEWGESILPASVPFVA